MVDVRQQRAYRRQRQRLGRERRQPDRGSGQRPGRQPDHHVRAGHDPGKQRGRLDLDPHLGRGKAGDHQHRRRRPRYPERIPQQREARRKSVASSR